MTSEVKASSVTEASLSSDCCSALKKISQLSLRERGLALSFSVSNKFAKFFCPGTAVGVAWPASVVAGAGSELSGTLRSQMLSRLPVGMPPLSNRFAQGESPITNANCSFTASSREMALAGAWMTAVTEKKIWVIYGDSLFRIVSSFI